MPRSRADCSVNLKKYCLKLKPSEIISFSIFFYFWMKGRMNTLCNGLPVSTGASGVSRIYLYQYGSVVDPDPRDLAVLDPHSQHGSLICFLTY